MGLAQCRRSFCNHLILEFLSVHPKIIAGQNPVVAGVGTGLIYTLAALATATGIGKLWGEATAHSASFYKHVFETQDVDDYFAANRKILARCATKFEKDFFGELEN